MRKSCEWSADAKARMGKRLLERHASLIRLLDAGWSVNRIARELRKAPGTICHTASTLRKYGIGKEGWLPGKTGDQRWDDADEIAVLIQLWCEGHSTAEIGRRIGRGKNAVIGKVHRLGLDPRPSPLRRAA